MSFSTGTHVIANNNLNESVVTPSTDTVAFLQPTQLRLRLSTLGAAVFLLGASEVLASAGVWHGKPTDSTWEPSFWSYELARLHYWLPLALVPIAMSFLIAVATSRWGKLLGATLFIICSAAVDYVASLFFRHSLPFNDAAYLGWSYQPMYVSDHLWSWLISMFVFGATLAFYFWRKYRLRKGSSQPLNS